MFTQEENIGEKIKELRKEKGLTLADITKLTGLSKTTVSDIENNKTSPNFKTLEKLSKILDIKMFYLQKELEIDELIKDNYVNALKTRNNDLVREINEEYIPKRNEIQNEHEKALNSFTIKLVEELLNENIIKDPENIPQEIVDLILVKLKKDIEMRKRSEK